MQLFDLPNNGSKSRLWKPTKRTERFCSSDNTKLTSLEERNAANHYDLMARFANVKIRSKNALYIAKNSEITINDKLKKQESFKKEFKTKITEITDKVRKDLSDL